MNVEELSRVADRVNKLVEFADTIGQAAPVLGTVFILAMTDEEYNTYVSDPSSIEAEPVRVAVESRCILAGINLD